MENNIGYVDKNIVSIEVKNLKDLELILEDIYEKEKALQEAVRKLEWFRIRFEFKQD